MFIQGVEKRASDSGSDFGSLLDKLKGRYQQKLNDE